MMTKEEARGELTELIKREVAEREARLEERILNTKSKDQNITI